MKNKLLCLLLVLSACTPDKYEIVETKQIGFAYQPNYGHYPDPLPVACYRVTSDSVTYWEPSCQDKIGNKLLKVTAPVLFFVKDDSARMLFDTCK